MGAAPGLVGSTHGPGLGARSRPDVHHYCDVSVRDPVEAGGSTTSRARAATSPAGSPRRNLWLGLAALLIVIGSLGSFLAARAVARNNGAKSHDEFVDSSREIASILKLAIQHEQDLALNAGAFFVGNPDATEAQFHQWTTSLHLFERYPELSGIGEIVMMPAAQLSAFAAHSEADPAGQLTNGTFQVIPAGARPYYCFETLTESANATAALPAGLDYCDTYLGPGFLHARDTGLGAYVPARLGKTTELGVGVPVYQGGGVPTTTQAREAAFLGWVGIEIRPTVLLDTALEGHPATAVRFENRTNSSTVSFSAGSAPAGAESTTIDLHNGWFVQTSGSVISSGLSASADVLALLLGGILLSLLLGALIVVLDTSRSRALHLVNERTTELRHLALHDSLTGLPNRALILDRIDQMLARSRRSHEPLAALFLDLDDFKDINDTLGHKAGDELLVAVGARLASALREGDTVGRLGGDEFVILVEGASLAAGADVVAQRILDVLENPFEIPSCRTRLTVTASIGVAAGDRQAPEELLRDADIALYRAKTAGKSRAVVFAPSMQLVVDEHRNLAVDLRRAIDTDQFFLLYQPTVDLATGAFTGVEALLRWRHPVRGIVQPDDFVPALESSGLIVPVGQWVLEAACRQGAAWHRQGHTMTVSVNISIRQLERDRIVDDVAGALTSSGLDPSMLILELTETTLMSDVEGTISRLQLMKALGVRLAVDDFGTGYSSLAYLRQFPIDVLKIDRTFVSGISDTKEAAALVHTLVQLGKALGLETIAEGIETDDQRVLLKAENIDGGQGFLFARPVDVVAIERLFSVARAEPVSVGGGGGAKSSRQLPVRDRRSFQ